MLKENIILSDLFSKAEVNRIMALDASLVSSDVKGYCKANTDKYVVVLNTWLYMCAQYIPRRAVAGLQSEILRQGLLPVIDACSQLASDIISSDFTLQDLGLYGFMMNDDPRITLQLLRYPKRFSPSKADKLADECLKDFIRLNARMKGTPVRINPQGKVLARTIEYPVWLLAGVRDYVSQLLHLDISDDDPIDLGRFSSGVSAEGCKTMFEKYREFARVAPGYKDNLLYPLPRYGNEDQGFVPPVDYVKVVAVPKSYKAVRLIAEVPVYIQYGQQGIRRRAIQSLATSPYADLIVLDDQTVNQEWSRLGSIYGTYCTTDLTAASDSIADHLARQVLPKSWYNVIQAWNPNNMRVRGKDIERNIFLTSGSGDTFVMESIIFLAIALYATETVERLTPKSEQRGRKKIKKPRVYGDDLICDTRVYDTLADFLRLLGFTVNESKSFNDGGYRESCGSEWWCGLDTATKFYSRKAFSEDQPDELPVYAASAIALQHRIYEFDMAEQWLSNHIKTLFIKQGWGTLRTPVTSSRVGEDCTDLWADFPFYHIGYPPFDRKEGAEGWLIDHPEVRREYHSEFGVRRHIDETIDDPTHGWLRRFQEYYGRPFVPQDRRLCEMFRYVDFLQHGTPVDEFGIPIHRQDVMEDLLIPASEWYSTRR